MKMFGKCEKGRIKFQALRFVSTVHIFCCIESAKFTLYLRRCYEDQQIPWRDGYKEVELRISLIFLRAIQNVLKKLETQFDSFQSPQFL